MAHGLGTTASPTWDPSRCGAQFDQIALKSAVTVTEVFMKSRVNFWGDQRERLQAPLWNVKLCSHGRRLFTGGLGFCPSYPHEKKESNWLIEILFFPTVNLHNSASVVHYEPIYFINGTIV